MEVYVDFDEEFKDYFKSNYHKGTVEVVRSLGSVLVNSVKYSIISAHYHAPSEHTVNGEHFDLEIHFVGKNDDGELHVIGVFFEVGEDSNEFIEETIQSLNLEKNVTFESTWILNDGTQSDYYFYNGSVTAPIVNGDCAEGVKWTVLKGPLSLTQRQLKFFEDVFWIFAGKGTIYKLNFIRTSFLYYFRIKFFQFS